MPRWLIPLVADSLYHVYNRGNNRQAVFFEPRDYAVFSFDECGTIFWATLRRA
jgi:hypothetical protein